MNKLSKNQKGISLYLGIIILSLIFAIALVVSDIFIIRLQLTRDIISSITAFYAADSSLECVQNLIANAQTTTCNGFINNASPDSIYLSRCANFGSDLDNGATAIISQTKNDITCDANNPPNLKSVKSLGVSRGGTTARSAEVDY